MPSGSESTPKGRKPDRLPAVRLKAGALSQVDRDYIRARAAAGVPPAAIAEHLGRSVRAVLAELAKVPAAGPADPEADAAVAELRLTALYRLVCREYAGAELEYFEQQWGQWVKQFRGDVTHADKEQLAKAIKYSIQMHRNAVRVSRLEREAARLERELDREREAAGPRPSEAARAVALALQTDLQDRLDAIAQLNKETRDFDGKHQALIEALKATRDQRVTLAEGPGTNWLAVIRSLQQAEARALADEQEAKARRALQAEIERLSKPHVFADGQPDRPLLTADTVGPPPAAPVVRTGRHPTKQPESATPAGVPVTEVPHGDAGEGHDRSDGRAVDGA